MSLAVYKMLEWKKQCHAPTCTLMIYHPLHYSAMNYFHHLDADGVDVVSWEWSPLDDNEATYTGESFREEQAVLIYRRENSA